MRVINQYPYACAFCLQVLIDNEHNDYVYYCSHCGNQYSKSGDAVGISWPYKGRPSESAFVPYTGLLPASEINDFKKELSKVDFSKPSTILPDAPKPKTPREIYEECYWKYVNSSTYEDATYWFNQMIAQ